MIKAKDLQRIATAGGQHSSDKLDQVQVLYNRFP